jgi:homospermidine synthase
LDLLVRSANRPNATSIQVCAPVLSGIIWV